jgi:hypothetical protein
VLIIIIIIILQYMVWLITCYRVLYFQILSTFRLVAQWLRHYATSRKVPGLIPGDVTHVLAVVLLKDEF